MIIQRKLFIGLVMGLICILQASNSDKTLVSWIKINDVTVSGGSILTIQAGDEFDGIVFGEKEKGKWIAGSDNWKRTQSDVDNLVAETEKNLGKMIQMAIVYEGNEIRIYRNGQLYSQYTADTIDLLNRDDNCVVFGLRHLGAGGSIAGEIEDARIYPQALSLEAINKLKPNVASDIAPYAWWDFEGQEIREKTGRYRYHYLGDGDLTDGKLVLNWWCSLVALREYTVETPEWPEDPPDNWLTYHLAHPGPGKAEPGDPNPAYFYKGRYHLHYIYNSKYGFSYAHVSSKDMLHWKWHPTVLAPPVARHGMFSGTGFFTKEGRPAMIYHGFGSGKNQLCYALDDHLDAWTKPEAIVPKNEKGELPGISHWDPDCWLIGDTYFALSGGKDPELMKSDDLKDWRYLGKLLHEAYPDDLGVDRDEDISCANMFKIGNRWMLLCISHHLGCRYYLGDFKDEKYLPDFHAKMNWVNTNWEGDPGGLVYFAPESMLSGDGRRIMWAWLITKASPTGVQSLPRELELPEDGILRIKPLKELEQLRYDGSTKENITVRGGDLYRFTEITGDAVELEINFSAPLPEEFEINLLADDKGENRLSIKAGAVRKTLGIGSINPPFDLKEGEDLSLRIFIDKNLVEVFANERQAAALAHKYIRRHPNIILYSRNSDLVVTKLNAWKMKTIYENGTVFRSQ
jgi:beta-fructofuranosidase